MTWRRTRHEHGVVVLHYLRPPENVVGFADLAELDEQLLAVAADETASVVVQHSDLAGYFVAHADLADVAALASDAPVEGPGPQMWGQALARMSEIPQPVVAALDGQAWGGGLEIALAATLRVASPRAHVRLVEVGHGAIPGAGGTQRLPRLVGPAAAADLVLRGQVLPADQAYRLGLVQAVLDEPDFLAAVLAWVEPMARAPLTAVRAAKHALVTGSTMSLEDGLAVEQQLFRSLLRTRGSAP